MSAASTPEAGRNARAGEHVPPGWTEVYGAQLRLLIRKQWKVLGALAVAAAGFTYLGLMEGLAANVLALLLGSPLYVLAWILAAGWAAGVWSDEGPGDRAYHWSLPVSRPVHDLTRVAIGAALYLVIGALGLAAGSLVFAVGGGAPTLGGVAAWGLIALALLTGFLLGTVPALASEHPVRWMVGVTFGYLILGGLLEEAAEKWTWLGGVETAVKSVWDGSHGLQAAMFAPHRVTGYAEETASGGAVGALLLWLGLAAATVVAVGFLHLERAKGAAE